jgi:hypothetical protein
MSPTDGENLLTKIKPKNLQKEYAFSMCNLNLRQASINANIVSSEPGCEDLNQLDLNQDLNRDLNHLIFLF